MEPTSLSANWFALTLLVAMIACLEIGRSVGRQRARTGESESGTGAGALEGAVFALFGLLIAFTFSGAATRFDSRRALIAQEANDIGTAYLRLDVLAPADQPPLRDLFRQYTETRLAVFASLPDIKAAFAARDRANGLQAQIWTRANSAIRQPEALSSAPMLLLPALNTMFDTTTTRTMAALTHPPRLIYYLLFLLGLECAFLGGIAMSRSGRRRWIYAMGFPLVIALAVFVTIELEYPRTGFISLNAYDQVLVDVRSSMK